MPRRKVGEENVRKILKISRSYYVSIPMEFVREFEWQNGQKLVVEKRGDGRLLVRDWKEGE